MNTIPENTLVSLLVNDDFINYVVNPTLSLTEMWEEFFSLHPNLIYVAEEAKMILLGENIPAELPADEVKEIENNIFNRCGLKVA